MGGPHDPEEGPLFHVSPTVGSRLEAVFYSHVNENQREDKHRLSPCGNCSSSRIRDLNTSKAKLRGAKDPREKIKTGSFS